MPYVSEIDFEIIWQVWDEGYKWNQIYHELIIIAIGW
jgi:hypothetical protein